MFPYRGLIVLIALCAFGAIQASYEVGDEFEGFKHGPHHGHHNSSNSSHVPNGNHSHPHHPGHGNSSHPSGNNTHPHPPPHHPPHHPGHGNSSHPSGNNTHPHPPPHHPPHHPGNGNSSHPHHPGHNNSSQPSGNYSHPLHPGHSNSSHWKVPKGNKSRYPYRPHYGFRPRPIRSKFQKENRPIPIDTNTNKDEVPQQRGWFNWRPFNLSKPHINRPQYQPIYRPAVNGSWYRPANKTWSNWG